jgi:hypothetical protein
MAGANVGTVRRGAARPAPRGRDRRPACRSPTSTRSSIPRPAHEGAADRLLHADRAGRAAAPPRPPADAQALPNGVTGQYFYEKQCPSHRPEWVQTTAVYSGSSSRTIHFCLCRRPADAGVARQPRRPRAAHVAGAGGGRQGADSDRVRPRPGAAGHDRRVRRGRAAAARGVRPLRPRGVPEDVGLEGHAGLRAAQHARHLRRHEDVRARARAGARAPPPEARAVGHEQAAAHGQGVRRLEPERRAQDDRQRLLAARAGAAHGLDAAHLGRGRGCERSPRR